MLSSRGLDELAFAARTCKAPVLITHPAFSNPGFGKHHPLSIIRHAAFLDTCAALGWLEGQDIREAPLADRAVLARFHTSDYLDALEMRAHTTVVDREVRERYNIGSMECPVFDGLWERICATVGGSILAANLALEGFLPFSSRRWHPSRKSGSRIRLLLFERSGIHNSSSSLRRP